MSISDVDCPGICEIIISEHLTTFAVAD